MWFHSGCGGLFHEDGSFIPCNKSIIGEKTTKLFLDHVFCYNGFPKDNVFLSQTLVCIQVLEAALRAIMCEGEVIINFPSPDKWGQIE